MMDTSANQQRESHQASGLIVMIPDWKTYQNEGVTFYRIVWEV